MTAPAAHLLLSALTECAEPAGPVASAASAGWAVPGSVPGAEAVPGPLTSEPPLFGPAPLTSEPPLVDIPPLTSEPTAHATAGGDCAREW
ncbi:MULTISPECIES: hypothetical protein [Streptomyces]|uniref:Secreted protein n=1 Tax=Streptomyces tsukubensis (strain DSM 42081 / NBRC 108919 / NRRL 18488 / 9993) TaxID=1114943 RepID=A0A7G3UNH0_STRT9|nr:MULTISPECIES: hypothetical protein [Streptomyces]AZK94095.1 hypothetical protein B7R87_09570 [Streptomyces tsukubensis]MYS62652.1 hypothetical protein [Streptomyces sp. SID5473]QKM71846.1 hypothetical protein STSU_024240 [Streptomyces tsukubensis NRRL18488]TAI46236.1 hypothetical protein EWI31_03920 [Streptomyces tsukubensis]